MDGANHIILHWIYCLFKNGLLESNFNAMSNKHKKFCICPSVVITIYIQVIFKYIIIGNDFLFQADYNEFRFIILSIGRGAMQVYALKKLVFSTLFWFNSIYWKTIIEMLALCSFYSWRSTILYRSILLYSTFSTKTFASASSLNGYLCKHSGIVTLCNIVRNISKFLKHLSA